MPPEPPDSLNSRETLLWNRVSYLYEDFCGSAQFKSLWPERTVRFQKVLREVITRLDETRVDKYA